MHLSIAVPFEYHKKKLCCMHAILSIWRDQALPVLINVQFSPAIAEKLHKKSQPDEGLTQIFNIESDFKVTLKPLHPNTKDPYLITHFIMELPDEILAKQVISRLLRSKFVEAAYIKPQDESP